MTQTECRVTQDLPAGHVLLLPGALEHPVSHRDRVGKILVRNIAAGSTLSLDDVLSMHDDQLRPLNEPHAIDQLVMLDRWIFNERGTVYADEPWTVVHLDCPPTGKILLCFGL